MAQGMSLHVGLNDVDPSHFKDSWKPLAAAEFDAESMAEVAVAQGFAVRSLIGADATRDAVIGEIRSAAGTLGTGDFFLFTYAAHGSQIPDKNGDEDADRLDETWCLFDGMLIDDEQHDLYTEFAPGVRVLVVSDSCHSGTVTRGRPPAETTNPNGLGFRHMPPAVAAATWRENREMYDEIQAKLIEKHGGPIPPSQAAVQLLAACQDHQLALDGFSNGHFTENLLRVWDGGSFTGSYEQLVSESTATMHAEQAVMRPPVNEQTPNHVSYGESSFEHERPFAIG